MTSRLGALVLAALALACGPSTLDGLAARASDPDPSAAGTGSAAGGGSAQPPGFELRGSRFMTPDGAELLVKGVNVNGTNWVWPGDVTRDLSYIADVWGFNLVRANCLISGQRLQDDDDLERLIAAFTARKVVVLLVPMDLGGGDFFSETSEPSLAALVEWHRALAVRYRDNPYVWFQIANGLGTCDLDPRWLEVHRRAVEAIRLDAGAPNVIVADGSVWGSEDGCSGDALVPDERSAILTYGAALRDIAGPSGGNLAFSLQVTAKWLPGGVPKLADFLDRALAKDFPVLISAYGAVGVSGADVTSIVPTMFEAVEPRRIGRVVWHWYNASGPPNWENSLVAAANGTTGAAVAFDPAHPQDPTNLSWLGERVWADTHK